MPASRARTERRRKAREATRILHKALYSGDVNMADDGDESPTDMLERALKEATAKFGRITLKQLDSTSDAGSSSQTQEAARSSAILAALKHMSTEQWQDGPSPLNSRHNSAAQDAFGAAMRKLQSTSGRRPQSISHAVKDQNRESGDMKMADPFGLKHADDIRSRSAGSHSQSPKGTMHANDQSEVEDDSLLSNTTPSTTESSSSSPDKPSMVQSDSAWSITGAQEPDVASSAEIVGTEQSDSLKGDVRVTSLPLQQKPGYFRCHPSGSKSMSGYDTQESPVSAHRKRVSQRMPIKPIDLRPSVSTEPSLTSASTSSEEISSMLEIEERDLEYKHRHTFVGTASLDDFLGRLDFSATQRTMRSTVVKAFIHLASTEQILARKSSPTPKGWEFVQRTISDTVPASDDYLMHAQVKLGIITLQGFLDMVPWDDQDQADIMSVVDAFCAASHLDQTLSRQSKARAFRSWVVREKLGRRTNE